MHKSPFKKGDHIVDLGGGVKPFKMPGITVFTVDKMNLPGVDAVRDLEEPFGDIGKFDGVHCSYVAEHISWQKIKQFFKSCYEILKEGGVAVFIVPDTLEQMKKVITQPKITLADSKFLFGEQDFPDNFHKIVFSKDFITDLLEEAGFNQIKIFDVPDPKARDIVVEAYRKKPIASVASKKTIKEMYDRAYFEDDSEGYVGFWDFPVHFKVVDRVAKMQPKSVLDVGAARGYVVKHLEARGIKAVAMDVSNHCFHTRATDSFVLHDATQIPWPFKDKEFDLLISTSFMEHIPEKQLPIIMREMERVSERSYHEITFTITPQDIDTTHQQGTIKPHEWWVNKFREVTPNYPTKILTMDEVHSISMEQPPLPTSDELVKINFGSHTSMFYYGWINSDIQDLSDFAQKTGRTFKGADARKPFIEEENVVDLITAHHLIEHLTREEGLTFLKNCYKAMRPGGVIRLSTPNVGRIITVYLTGNLRRNYSCVNVGIENARDETDALFQLLYEGHKTLFNTDALIATMEGAGFINVKSMPFNESRSETIQLQTIDSHPTLSIYVEGEKLGTLLPPMRDPVVHGPVITVEPDVKPYQRYLEGDNEG